VFVEEVSFRSKSIEGVSTSTTAFVGPTRRGPVGEVSELLTSFAEFERVYGGLEDLGPADARRTNYMAHAAFAYFNEGGARLYVSRVYPVGNAAPPPASSAVIAAGAEGVTFVARHGGTAGNATVRVRQLLARSSVAAARKAIDGSVMRVRLNGAASPTFFVKRSGAWLDSASAAAPAFVAADEAIPADENTAGPGGMHLVTLEVIVEKPEGSVVYEDLGFDPQHKRYVATVLSQNPTRRIDALTQSHAIRLVGSLTPFELQAELAPPAGQNEKVFTVGTGANSVAGTDPVSSILDYQAALTLIEALDEVSIVAAPGYSALSGTDSDAVALQLIAHAEKRRAYRIAVLDTPPDLMPTLAQAVKSKLDSKYAALYYPWVVVANPLATSENASFVPKELALPPSGFVCGIYARSDVERGVFKAPANEVIRGALRFQHMVSTGEQEVLNPLGINCLRAFPNRGLRVWGARTTSSDPEWNYVNIRRYFNYVERSIDRGTQWAVFEPNGERLWANVRETVTSFLFNEWKSGALLGDKPEQAFFVKCDRSTMTQNDLDGGRLICLVGIAAIKPAEFVIFRIGQKTVEARN
jgi:hypothetical protein